MSDHCNACGVCCMHMNSPPFMPEELDELMLTAPDVFRHYKMAKHSMEVGRKAHGMVDGIPCFWFDMVTRRCRHYEHRPEICQEFEVNSLPCMSMRSDAGLVQIKMD